MDTNTTEIEIGQVVRDGHQQLTVEGFDRHHGQEIVYGPDSDGDSIWIYTEYASLVD